LVEELKIDSRSDEEIGRFDISNEHFIIKNTHTTLGFSADDNTPQRILKSGENVFPIVQLLVKKTDINHLISRLKKHLPYYFLGKSAGKTDLVLLPKNGRGIPLVDLINLILKIIPEFSEGIVSINTQICFAQGEISTNQIEVNDSIKEGTNLSGASNSTYHELFDRMAFPPSQIEIIIDKLRRARIPKLIRDGLVNLLGEYNCGIKDTLLYSYFFELTPFIINLFREIEAMSISDISENKHRFEVVLEHFRSSYDHRFQQSFVNNDITDNNFFFKGGIQGFLSIYSMIYEAYSARLGNPQGLVSVQGHSGIDSDHYGISLNYLHIVQPILVINHVIYETTINFINRIALEDVRLGTDSFYPVLGKVLVYGNFPNVPALEHLIRRFERKQHTVESEQRNNLLAHEFYNILTDPEIILHFVTDIIALQVLFRQDFERQYFLYFGLFSSFPTSGTRLDSYNEDKVNEFMCRITLLEIYAKRKNWAKDFNISSSSFFFDNASGEAFEHTKEFFYPYFQAFFESEFMSKLIFEIENLLALEIGPIKPGFNQSTDHIDNFLITVMDEFNNYLDILKSQPWYLKDRRSVHIRGKIGSSQKDENLYLFDQLGGYFIRDQNKRAEYLSLRLKTINKLIDATLKYKFNKLIHFSEMDKDLALNN